MANVEKLRKLYSMQMLCIIALITAATLIIKHIWQVDNMFYPLSVSVSFSVVVNISDILVWYKVAKKAPDYFPIFYTAASGFRMLLALLVMLIYYLVADGNNMLLFFIVFMSFYIILLIHHAVFFARVSANT